MTLSARLALCLGMFAGIMYFQPSDPAEAPPEAPNWEEMAAAVLDRVVWPVVAPAEEDQDEDGDEVSSRDDDEFDSRE